MVNVLQCKCYLTYFLLSFVIAEYLLFSHVVKILSATLENNKLSYWCSGSRLEEKKINRWEGFQIILSAVNILTK